MTGEALSQIPWKVIVLMIAGVLAGGGASSLATGNAAGERVSSTLGAQQADIVHLQDEVKRLRTQLDALRAEAVDRAELHTLDRQLRQLLLTQRSGGESTDAEQSARIHAQSETIRALRTRIEIVERKLREGR